MEPLNDGLSSATRVRKPPRRPPSRRSLSRQKMLPLLLLLWSACCAGVPVVPSDWNDSWAGTAEARRERRNRDSRQPTETHTGDRGFVAPDADGNYNRLLVDLVRWVADQPGAYVSPKMQIRQCRDKPGYGVFATGDIHKDEVVVTVPPALMIWPVARSRKDNWFLQNAGKIVDGYHTENLYHYAVCLLIQQLYEQLMQSNESNSTTNPYIAYLKQQPTFYLPALWTREGRVYLNSIIPETLPPIPDIATHLENSLLQPCTDILELPNFTDLAEGRTPDPSSASFDAVTFLHAWTMVLARAEDDVMIPLYDMFNHQNGKKLNTKHRIDDERHFSLIASKNIRTGQEIFNTYTHCESCDTRLFDFGTPDMFRIYGFVESYPQRYFGLYADEPRYYFDVDWKKNGGDTDDDDDDDNDDHGWNPDRSSLTEAEIIDRLEVTFVVPVCEEAVEYFRSVVEELEARRPIRNSFALDDDVVVPESELVMAQQLYDALSVAFKAALRKAENEPLSDVVWKMGRSWFSPYWESVLVEELEETYGNWSASTLEDEFLAQYRDRAIRNLRMNDGDTAEQDGDADGLEL